MQAKKTNLLKTLSYLTLFIFFVQIWAGLLHILQPIPMSNLSVGFNKEILHSNIILLGFLHFILAQLFIYALFTLVLYIIAISIAFLFNLSMKATYWLGIFIWLFAILFCFLANEYFFPWSIFSFLPHTITTHFVLKYILVLFAIIFGVMVLLTLAAIYKRFLNPKYASLIVVGLVIPLLGFSYLDNQSLPMGPANKPNIIIIGIDSLRPDHTSFFNSKNQLTPHIDKFLNKATVFSHAYTPLARTFPAWMSILTGKDPKLNGARYNLTPFNKIANVQAKNLAHLLQKQGYTTLFATDDRRFNHITKAYGFNFIVAPKTGFNDFVLGSFNDFFVTNLIINTRLGQWLFPYSYANRSSDITYEPKTFTHFLARKLKQINKRPLFISIHLCLPHWPFIWASAAKIPIPNEILRTQKLYNETVKRADLQFQNIINTLKENSLLKHVFIVLMSDHGQGLGLPGERVTSQQGYLPGKTRISDKTFKFLTANTFGHGTDILNLSQIHIVFAFRSIGLKTKQVIGINNTPTSLIDIAPTIANYLNLSTKQFQGISLLPIITGTTKKRPNRNLIMESGFTLPGILVAAPKIKQVLEQGLSYFRIEPKTGALVIRNSLGKLIIKGKQKALIHYPWLVAIYPLDKKHWITLVANMKTKRWTTDFNSELAKKAHAKKLLTALEKFYAAPKYPLQIPGQRHPPRKRGIQ